MPEEVMAEEPKDKQNNKEKDNLVKVVGSKNKDRKEKGKSNDITNYFIVVEDKREEPETQKEETEGCPDLGAPEEPQLKLRKELDTQNEEREGCPDSGAPEEPRLEDKKEDQEDTLEDLGDLTRRGYPGTSRIREVKTSIKRVEYFVDTLDKSRKEMEVEIEKPEDRDTKAAGPGSYVSKEEIDNNILELIGKEEVREVQDVGRIGGK